MENLPLLVAHETAGEVTPWEDVDNQRALPAAGFYANRLAAGCLNGDELAVLRTKALDLGVASWWALNLFSGKDYSADEIALDALAEDEIEGESWWDRDPASFAFAAVVLNRFSGIWTATGYPKLDLVVSVDRQLLGVANHCERFAGWTTDNGGLAGP